jgi:hypothetical protein
MTSDDVLLSDDDLDIGVLVNATSLDPQIVAMLRFETRKRNVGGAGKAGRRMRRTPR